MHLIVQLFRISCRLSYFHQCTYHDLPAENGAVLRVGKERLKIVHFGSRDGRGASLKHG
jgi:hypothetical protein